MGRRHDADTDSTSWIAAQLLLKVVSPLTEAKCSVCMDGMAKQRINQRDWACQREPAWLEKLASGRLSASYHAETDV